MDEFKNDAEAEQFFKDMTPDQQMRYNVKANRKLAHIKEWKKTTMAKLAPIKEALTSDMTKIMNDVPDGTVIQVGDKFLSWQTKSSISTLNEDNVSSAIGVLSTSSKEEREASIARLNIAKMLQDRERNKRRKAASAEKKRKREEAESKQEEREGVKHMRSVDRANSKRVRS